jgi:hypothetical protein
VTRIPLASPDATCAAWPSGIRMLALVLAADNEMLEYA